MAVSVKIEPVERLPLEWNDWTMTPFRQNGSGMQSQSQSQSIRSFKSSGKARAAYPNQRAFGAGLIQQQGEQQQQS
jgi:hypothetical protein